MSRMWKCRKCGAIQHKGGDMIGDNSMIANPVGFLQQAINGGLSDLVSTETCTNCGAKYNRDDIREGKHDVREPRKPSEEVAKPKVKSERHAKLEKPHTQKQTDIYEILMDAICCVMCADRKIATREREAVQKVMEKTKAPWTREDIDNRINKFLACARKDGMKKIVQKTCEKLPEFEKRRKKNVLLQCIDYTARADGLVHEKEIELINKFRERLHVPPVNIVMHKKTGEAEKEKEVKVSSGSTSSAETYAVPTITPAATEPIEASSLSFAQTIRAPDAKQVGDEIAATIAVPPDKDAVEIQREERDVPFEWEKGQTILDLYEVEHVHTGGGMGLVYKVHHKNWNVDLAVKSPRVDYFKTEDQKENFIKECETWIDLGLHPNIVSCYYVRNLGGIPHVFAEYFEGGNLKEWIETKRLYQVDIEGNEEKKRLERILDIAIQFAWGLQYAHEKNLVHQDVKPANVMLAEDGTAKVTDFGLAKARAAVREIPAASKQQSILVSSGGMTPAYCSPEQANKQQLSHKTDIWSWSLSVLEMFAGGVFWKYGQAAPEALDSYLEGSSENESIPKMPDRLADLLKQCFQRNPDNRPQDMEEIVNKLQEIYKKTIGQKYVRPEPKPIDLLADELNNKALSMLDLGRKEEAEKLWHSVLENNPLHLPSVFNLGLVQWENAQITDDEFVRRLDRVYEGTKNDDSIALIARVHLLRNCPSDALEALGKVVISNSSPDTISEEVLNLMGVALVSAGDFKKAESYLRNALSKSQDNWNCLLNLIFALRQQKKEVPSDLTSRVHSNADRICEFYSLPYNIDVINWINSWQVGGFVKKDVFERIPSSVWGVAFCHDGRLAFSYGAQVLNKTVVEEAGQCGITMWACDRKKTCEAAGSRLGSVANVSASDDGTVVVSGAGNQLVELHLRKVTRMRDKIRHITVSESDPKATICYGLGASTIDLNSGVIGKVFGGECCSCSAFSADGLLLALGHDGGFRNNMLVIFDSGTGDVVNECGGPAPIHALAWLDNTTIATAGYLNGAIRIDDLTMKMKPRYLEGHTEGVTCLACSSNKTHLWSSGLDGTIRLWDVNTGRCLTTLKAGKFCNCVALSPDGQKLAAGGLGGVSGQVGEIHLWSLSLSGDKAQPYIGPISLVLSRPSSLGELTKKKEHVNSLMKEAQHCIEKVDKKEALKLLRKAQTEKGFERDLKVISEIRRCASEMQPVCLQAAWPAVQLSEKTYEPTICLNSTADKVGLIPREGNVGIWDLNKQHFIKSENIVRGYYYAVSFTPNGKKLVLPSLERPRLTFLNVENGMAEDALDFSESVKMAGFYDIALASSSPKAICSCNGHGRPQGAVVVIDLSTKKVLHQWTYNDHFTRDTAISADGKIAVVASNYHTGGDNYIRVYDTTTGDEICQLGDFSSSPTCVDMTPDGRFAAAGSFSNVAAVWDIHHRKQIGDLLKHDDQVLCVALSKDGRFCLTGSRDKTIKLWDVCKSKCLYILKGHENAVKKVNFTPDLFRIISVDIRGIVFVWELDWIFNGEQDINQRESTNGRDLLDMKDTVKFMAEAEVASSGEQEKSDTEKQVNKTPASSSTTIDKTEDSFREKRNQIASKLYALADSCGDDSTVLLIQPIASSIETGMAPDGKPTNSKDEIAALYVAAQMLEKSGKTKEAMQLVFIIKEISELGDKGAGNQIPPVVIPVGTQKEKPEGKKEIAVSPGSQDKMKTYKSLSPTAAEWYYVENSSKHVRQIVLKLPPNSEVPPRVKGSLVCGRMAELMKRSWAGLVLFLEGSTEEQKGPFIFAKANNVVQFLKGCETRIAFAFYQFPTGGMLQIFVTVQYPKEKAKETMSFCPFLAENVHWPDSSDSKELIPALLDRDIIEVCFVADRSEGPCCGYFGLRTKIPEDCKAALKKEWQSITLYQTGLSPSQMNRAAAMAQFEKENPLEENPVLNAQVTTKTNKVPLPAKPSADLANSDEIMVCPKCGTGQEKYKAFRYAGKMVHKCTGCGYQDYSSHQKISEKTEDSAHSKDAVRRLPQHPKKWWHFWRKVTVKAMTREQQEALWLRPMELWGAGLGTAKVVTIGESGTKTLRISPEVVKWAASILEMVGKADNLAKQGKHMKAINAYKQVLNKAPNAAIVLMSIGVCYCYMGDKANALKWMRQAKSADPDNERVIKNLRIAEKL